MSKVLFIAPHADDEVLGCGATMNHSVNKGDDVYVLIATNASVGAPELFSPQLIKTVREEALAAHKLLGVKETLFLELPAPALDQYPCYKIADAIAEVLKRLDVDTVYIPHRGDSHKDHRAIHEAALVACRPVPGAKVKRVYAYETLSETEWGEPIPSEVFVPNRFVAVSESEFEMKLKAMSCFKSQLREFPSTRSLECIEALGKLRGATVGSMRAEAFEVIREID